MQEAGGWIRRSVWDGNHIDWVRKEVSQALVAEVLNSSTEEGDGAITNIQISWLTGFGYRGFNYVFPDGGNIADCSG